MEAYDTRALDASAREIVEQAKAKRQEVRETLKKFSDHLDLLKSL